MFYLKLFCRVFNEYIFNKFSKYIKRNSMKLLESNNILSFISNIKKYSSTTSSYYVGKSKVQHYWSQNCCELEKMYPKGKFIVLLDDEPILQNVKESDILKTRLVRYDFDDITMKFKEYGLQIINDNTVFLDVLLPEKEGYDYVSKNLESFYYYFII